MSEKIIFVDVHGPLQPARVSWGETVIHTEDDQYDRLDPIAIDCLKRVVRKSGAKIVMNSTLNRHNEDFMVKLFELNGYPEWPEDIHANWKTNYPDLHKDLSVLSWLQGAKSRGEEISHYVIWDDMDLNNPNLIKIDFDNGITMANYNDTMKMLGIRESFIIY